MYSILLCISMQLPLINNHFKGYSEVSNMNYEQFLLHLPDVSHSLRSIFYLYTNSLYLRCSFYSGLEIGNFHSECLNLTNRFLIQMDTSMFWFSLPSLSTTTINFTLLKLFFFLSEDSVYSEFKVPKDKRMNFY